jgi:hypothetical protein
MAKAIGINKKVSYLKETIGVISQVLLVLSNFVAELAQTFNLTKETYGSEEIRTDYMMQITATESRVLMVL